MKKAFRILLLIYLGISLHAPAQTGGARPDVADTGKPQFTFITNRYFDFGAMAFNSTASYNFQFKNTGTRPLIISEMHYSPVGKNDPLAAIQISYSTKAVKPGKKGNINITVTTSGNIGSFNNTIYVNSNAAAENYPLLLLVGAVVPASSGKKEKEVDTHGFFEFLGPMIMANTPNFK